ncbi:YggS family pyridoxal phosphate-dependent enzyme [Algiphilus sp. W345]|uniref:Pyridoxal phosphate homeostasis protein n=1 Tax=Banduia mediterranea TaxID=3075609 RepID=A0ABU2WFP6_9GAMM|nr:YggS family pyridoxal phosphate-dependent enzyme [Algiphilus sp. W345]MDT0496698.1 YggS family pyridoxal phosphate-dependent enzyme [Algiphilus sp. W345]
MTGKKTHIAENLAQIRARIAQASAAAGRAPGTVRLLAMSKTFDVETIRDAVRNGQRAFGENYLSEAVKKMDALADCGLEWHFTGPVQSNKTREIASRFDWVHGVDRDRIARRLGEQRPASLGPLNVCVQVNIDGEASKSGVAPGDAAALCEFVAAQPGLRLRGLMTIPARVAPEGDARRPYRRLRELYESLIERGLELDTLSAGMSGDFEVAIAEGATLVRIGTALFGTRPAKPVSG